MHLNMEVLVQLKSIGLSLVIVGLLSACATKQAQVEAPPAPTTQILPTSLDEAVKSSYRTEENTKRDQYRHPIETLNFFGIKPDMTVVEISPGAGWYMEILAPYLAARGHYIAATPPSNPENTYMAELNAKVAAWLKSHPEVEKSVQFTAFNPPTQLEIAPPNSADMVLTFRNVHNWMSKGAAYSAFKAFYKALKPGGVLGVVEHRAAANSKKIDPQAKSGYVPEERVIHFAKQAGFVLQEKSEINANPKDTKDHPEGVWTLPPTLRLGDEDKEKYLAIGESDRMTMRFVKPAGKMPKKLPKKNN
jgi:predicted methyltransferase